MADEQGKRLLIGLIDLPGSRRDALANLLTEEGSNQDGARAVELYTRTCKAGSGAGCAGQAENDPFISVARPPGGASHRPRIGVGSIRTTAT